MDRISFRWSRHLIRAKLQTDGKEERFLTREYVCLRFVAFAMRLSHPREKERKRTQGDVQSSFHAHQRSTAIIYFTIQLYKRNPCRHNVLENVTFVLSSARVSSV